VPVAVAAGNTMDAVMAATIPMGTLTQNTSRQPCPARSQLRGVGPRIGPTVAAIPDRAATAAIAGPRSLGRYNSWIWDSTCGIIAAANRPCTIRAATSMPGLDASEQIADAAENPMTPTTNTRL